MTKIFTSILLSKKVDIQSTSRTITSRNYSLFYYLTCVCARDYLKVWLLENPGQFSRAVVFNLETADVAQDLRHQLHVVILHCLQLHFLQLFVSLREMGKTLREGGCVLLSYFLLCVVS